MNHEHDLPSKVHELFDLITKDIDKNLDKLIKSGCGILDDDDQYGNYLVAKAFVAAFMDDQIYRLENSLRNRPEFHELMENYSKFL